MLLERGGVKMFVPQYLKEDHLEEARNKYGLASKSKLRYLQSRPNSSITFKSGKTGTGRNDVLSSDKALHPTEASIN
jgi:hypothetical protein